MIIEIRHAAADYRCLNDNGLAQIEKLVAKLVGLGGQFHIYFDKPDPVQIETAARIALSLNAKEPFSLYHLVCEEVPIEVFHRYGLVDPDDIECYREHFTKVLALVKLSETGHVVCVTSSSQLGNLSSYLTEYIMGDRPQWERVWQEYRTAYRHPFGAPNCGGFAVSLSDKSVRMFLLS